MIDNLEVGAQVIFREKKYTVTEVMDSYDLVRMELDKGQAIHVSKSLLKKEGDSVTDFIPRRTKTEIDARIDELQSVIRAIVTSEDLTEPTADLVTSIVCDKISELQAEKDQAPTDIFSAIIESHKVLCSVKKMGEKEAYGQNPAFYYSAAIGGEAGELINKAIRALRYGGDATEKLRQAVLSELPDVVIYSFILAYVLDIDLTRLVTEKANVVVKRAKEGYYGGPLIRE